MVKIMTIGIHSIVTVQAFITKVQDVVKHEGGVHLEVTGSANGLVESCENLRMTVVTTEGGTIGLALVGG
jgi:hypothetical protein